MLLQTRKYSDSPSPHRRAGRVLCMKGRICPRPDGYIVRFGRWEPNHVHLLLRTGITPLSTVMRRLLTGYAVSFNLRHRRSGH